MLQALVFLSHHPRWLWTNFAPLSILAVAFFVVPSPFNYKVDDILDPHLIFLSVVQNDLPPLALVNKVGSPWRTFSTFMTSPQSCAFRDAMVWENHIKTHTKPSTDEREHALGFCTGTTTSYGFFEGQRRFVLGQAMDLNTMVLMVNLCFALQRHHDD